MSRYDNPVLLDSLSSLIPASPEHTVAVIDPGEHPILARHYFNVETQPPLPVEVRRLIASKTRALHRRGPDAFESFTLAAMAVCDSQQRDVLLRALSDCIRIGEVDCERRAA
jgi:hypothetical protein